MLELLHLYLGSMAYSFTNEKDSITERSFSTNFTSLNQTVVRLCMNVISLFIVPQVLFIGHLFDQMGTNLLFFVLDRNHATFHEFVHQFLMFF